MIKYLTPLFFPFLVQVLLFHLNNFYAHIFHSFLLVIQFLLYLKTELGSLTRFQNSKIIVDEISKIRKQEIKIEEVKIILH